MRRHFAQGITALAVTAALLAGCSETGTPSLPTASHPSASLSLSSVRMVGPQDGWSVQWTEAAVALLRTTDGGQIWANVTPPRATGIWGFDIYPIGTNELWASAGKPGTSNVIVYHTTDGGAHWRGLEVKTRYTGGVPVRPVSFSFVDEAHGWLMVSPDHGMNSEPGELLATGVRPPPPRITSIGRGTAAEPGAR